MLVIRVYRRIYSDVFEMPHWSWWWHVGIVALLACWPYISCAFWFGIHIIRITTLTCISYTLRHWHTYDSYLALALYVFTITRLFIWWNLDELIVWHVKAIGMLDLPYMYCDYWRWLHEIHHYELTNLVLTLFSALFRYSCEVGVLIGYLSFPLELGLGHPWIRDPLSK